VNDPGVLPGSFIPLPPEGGAIHVSEYIAHSRCSATSSRLYDYMVERARLRDRLYFCADETAARDLGVSRRTIIRARKELERSGRIVRENRRAPVGRAVVYSFPPRTLRRSRERPQRTRVTQRSSSRRSGRAFNPRYARVASLRLLSTMKGEVEPQSLPPLVGEKVTAQHIIAAVVDTFGTQGIPLTSRARGMLARQSKELLGDGFSADVILAAAVISVRRGAPAHMHFIAQDIAVAMGGMRMERRAYEAQLNAAHKLLDPEQAQAASEHRERLHRILGGAS
jgi:hypothetical protein